MPFSLVTIDEQIRLNELLLERERLFVRVAQIEAKVDEIVDGDFPFEPPDLPCQYKPPKTATKESKATKIRRLREGEAAYRVRYLQGADEREELHAQAPVVERLLKLGAETLRVTRVEIVDEHGYTRERLFAEEEE